MKIKNDVTIKNIDIQGLKRKGLSNKKISKILGVSIKKVDKIIKSENKIRKYSGVF